MEIKGALIPLWVDELIKEQKETGFLSKEPVEVHGTKVTPYDLTLRLWDTIPKNRDNGPESSGLKVIVKGVVAPEGCIDPEKFLAALLKRGARIHQTETIGSLFSL